MNILSTAKRMLRGEVSARTAALEGTRRLRQFNMRRRERASLVQLDQQPARLREEFARVSASDLLTHFHSRVEPNFFPGFQDLRRTGALQQQIYPNETARLIEQAERIANDHCWPLLGFGEKCFGKNEIDWHRDPLSGFQWPLDFHADINLFRDDGSDARVLWELNRLSHFITLGRAYSITNDERFSVDFFSQLGSWRTQNPIARGVNWNCAMEVALRAMNLLTAFNLFLRAPQMDDLKLKEILKLFDQHGAHIQRNLEFSYIATSNHYLADVTGLLWIGVLLPELQAAAEWREFGLRELLSEMEKQTLADGADYEASTGYHRLKVELFLYSFVLCHLNGIDIEEKYWNRLRAMLAYIAAYLRPDGRAPLVGDSDSGQVMQIVHRAADEHSYVMALGAAVFQEPRFKLGAHASVMQRHASEEQHAGGMRTQEELLWILGAQGLRDYQSLPEASLPSSQGFPNAGMYVLRQDDLYLLFNASDSGVNGRGSHGHNDALSIELSACGVPFIIDPGTYLYVANLNQRHLFRSTAYHSTVQIDAAEQNSIDVQMPFIIGNEARPRVLDWQSTGESDTVTAEHRGYCSLTESVTHQRRVQFDKRRRCWLVSDELRGQGEHELIFRFHFAPGLDIQVRPNGSIDAYDKMTGSRLIIESGRPDGAETEPDLEPQFASVDYGAKVPSLTARWVMKTKVPFTMNFILIPICAGENETARRQTASSDYSRV